MNTARSIPWGELSIRNDTRIENSAWRELGSPERTAAARDLGALFSDIGCYTLGVQVIADELDHRELSVVIAQRECIHLARKR